MLDSKRTEEVAETAAEFTLPGEERLLPPSVAAVIANLEADIIHGRILPRSRLIEDHLMEDYNAKRHTVRAALDELGRLGVIVKPRHRGAELRRFDAKSINQLYEIRELLHRAAIRGIRQPTDAQIANLERWLREHAKVSASTDVVAIHRANMMFHEALFGLCGNPFITASIRQYDWVSFPIRAYGVGDRSALAQAGKEHIEMVDHLKAGRMADLENLAVTHMKRARDLYEMKFPESKPR
ncbi:hypothetical protein CQ13_37375 [Bradyrhizobium retamae]|uniref:HTH gntR-type domain-containing protein n=2 Tax=Bradyrhizobium retamae TaxID=1300035 RepID=A0A0R3MCK7_9BRAD|nr:hypothetical protein CQ13_37375 [Bradyrhizobium retamae]